MRKTLLVCSLLLSMALMLAVSLPALADDITGHYNGNWTCTGPDCEKKGGGMDGDLKQDGGKVTGHFNLHNTVAGDINGPLNGSISGNMLRGDINASGHRIHVDGTVSGTTISGNFSSPEMGNGTFKIHR